MSTLHLSQNSSILRNKQGFIEKDHTLYRFFFVWRVFDAYLLNSNAVLSVYESIVLVNTFLITQFQSIHNILIDRDSHQVRV